MALTYLNSQMIEIPASIADLSAQNLQVTNLIATNLITRTQGNADQWNQTYTNVTTNSGSWNTAFQTINLFSNNWNFAYDTVESSYRNWDSTLKTVNFLSGNWSSNYNTTRQLSGNWQTTHNTVTALSANWQRTYTTVNTLSNLWEETADIIPAVTNYLSTNNVKVQDITFLDSGSNLFNNAAIFGDVIIYGTLSALSGAQIFQGLTTTVASSLSVQNYGPGPALYVFQDTCLESVVVVKGADNSSILTVNNTTPDFKQDGVKIYFSGTGNTFVVGNSSNNTAFVVTSAGNTNTTGQILSAGTPLHSIFLTSETDSQNLTYNEETYNLEISNGNVVNLSSINTTTTNNSAKWEDVYSVVSSLSSTWEESADIIPAVTNYLSNNSVTISSITTNSCIVNTCTVTSLNVTQQLLSAGTDLFNIFVTSDASSNWETTYQTVSTLSASWEESADVTPTVTNYLSTNLVTVSSLSAANTLTTSNFVILSTEQLPTLSTDTGIKGTFKWDSNYLYICVETDTWKRVALTGWEG